MNLFLSRDEYTNNRENWPVVPFSLLRFKDATGIFKTNYNLGFEEWQILGLGLSISDELYANGIKRPTLMWVKEPTSGEKDWEPRPIESETYYMYVSPLCYQFRENIPGFKEDCKYRDRTVVRFVFDYMDGIYGDQTETVLPIPIKKHNSCEENDTKETIEIHIKRDAHNRLYFRYECPCMNLTETLYPIECEGITIALIMVGQLVDEDYIEDVKKAYDTQKNKCEKHNGCECTRQNCLNEKESDCSEEIKPDRIDKVKEIVLKEIDNIQDVYQEQVRAERRRIMNEVLDELAEIQRRFSLYDPNEKLPEGNVINLRDFENVAAPARECFRKSLDLLEDAFGVEQVRLYFDHNFDFECSQESVFYKNWMKKERAEREPEYPNIAGEHGVGDLFKNFKGIPPKEGLTTESITPKAPDWSVFIFPNAVITDEAGISNEVPPLIIGIKFKGGLSGKERYQRVISVSQNNELLWCKYVLHKFSIFARGVMLSIYLHKQTDTLLESRVTTKHETGQVSHGLEGVSAVFEARRNNIANRMKECNPELLQKFNEFIRYCELYEGDVNGLFLRIRLSSQIYGNNPIPKPKSGDVYKVFLNKWNYAFFSNCRENNTEFFLDRHRPHLIDIRRMYTDFNFLEHAIYNIAGNGIKHAFKYSRVTLIVEKDENGHIFKIINFGDYLNPGDEEIYERGKRNRHGLNAPHEAGRKSHEREYVGMGMGLYIAKKLIKSLQGDVSYDCQTESDFNIPLVDYYYEELREGHMIKLDGWKDEEIYKMKEEYENLKTNEKLSDILAHNIGGRSMDEVRKEYLANIPDELLSEEMREPTYRVEFAIKVPHYKNQGE